jgi:pSer/pThr/pTyr-binding forkhead associated (FHA) protein
LVASAALPPIRLDRVLVVVGRHPECDAQLNSPRVSRWHCCMTEVDGEVWVRDLGSANGTWINGRRIVSGLLRPGDEISIAHVRYYLQESLTIGAAETHRASRREDAEDDPA